MRMGLTQQLARVSPEYLEQCRRTAAAAPDGDPQWDPPDEDTLDLDWAIWGLIRFCGRSETDAGHRDILQRSIEGDAGGVEFLDHREVHDGFDAPPALHSPAAVAKLAEALNTIDLHQTLTHLPQDAKEAAQACGFEWKDTHPRAYLTRHFTALRDFYNTASQRNQAILTWVD